MPSIPLVAGMLVTLDIVSRSRDLITVAKFTLQDHARSSGQSNLLLYAKRHLPSKFRQAVCYHFADFLRGSFMGQPVVHLEIGCRDGGKTSTFFVNPFGWNMQPMGPASMIDTGADSGIHGHISVLGHEPPLHHLLCAGGRWANLSG
jgi:hypothetical protein